MFIYVQDLIRKSLNEKNWKWILKCHGKKMMIAIPLVVQFDMSVEIDEGTCQGKT